MIQERLNFLSKGCIAPTSVVEEGRSFSRFSFQGFLEELLDLLKAF